MSYKLFGGLIMSALICSLVSCGSKVDHPMNETDNSIDTTEEVKIEEEVPVIIQDSVIHINQCQGKDLNYISILEEHTYRKTDAFVLTIATIEGDLIREDTLDARAGMSQINYCSKDYVAVGFSCGGPCYSQIFVFKDPKRPIEQYNYGHRVSNNPNIIAHIKDEEFERLRVHNFDNGKEIIVEIPDREKLFYNELDTLYLNNDLLVLRYVAEGDSIKEKTLNVKELYGL